jgi:glycosyltransferase involved in cell wall biosynthesis
VIVTSHGTAESVVRDYGVTRARVFVVEPGTEPAPLAAGSAGADVQLLCVAALVPRKGHKLLLRALATVSNRRWRLICVGSLDRDADLVERLRRLAIELGLEDRIAFAGEADGTTLPGHYAAADVFVLPTLYEGYGMAVAEALACGLPVISTRTGAIAELVGDSAGIIVPPADQGAFARAIERIFDPSVRQQLARGARRVRDVLPTWKDAARRMDDVLSGAIE